MPPRYMGQGLTKPLNQGLVDVIEKRLAYRFDAITEALKIATVGLWELSDEIDELLYGEGA